MAPGENEFDTPDVSLSTKAKMFNSGVPLSFFSLVT